MTSGWVSLPTPEHSFMRHLSDDDFVASETSYGSFTGLGGGGGAGRVTCPFSFFFPPCQGHATVTNSNILKKSPTHKK